MYLYDPGRRRRFYPNRKDGLACTRVARKLILVLFIVLLELTFFCTFISLYISWPIHYPYSHFHILGIVKKNVLGQMSTTGISKIIVSLCLYFFEFELTDWKIYLYIQALISRRGTGMMEREQFLPGFFFVCHWYHKFHFIETFYFYCQRDSKHDRAKTKEWWDGICWI